MSNPITVVAGLGRCGSSLMMQMLRAGGMQLLENTGPPLYEHTGTRFIDKKAATVHFDTEWPDKVIKILGLPPPDEPPLGLDYKILFMQRDRKEQGKSFRKFGKVAFEVFDRPFSKGTHDKIIGQSSENIKKHWARRGELYIIDFEKLLKAPKKVLKNVARYLGRDLDLNAAAGVVRPRSAKCLKGFLEYDTYKDETGKELDLRAYTLKTQMMHENRAIEEKETEKCLQSDSDSD